MKKDCQVIPVGGVVLILLVTTTLLHAYAPDTLWTRTYGGADLDRGDCVQQTSDGGYIIVGSTASFGIYVDIYLIKTDSLGNTIWTQTYGDSGCDCGHSVKQTIEGGYVIVGSRWDTTGGYEDLAYLIKTNSDGDTLWTRTFFVAGAQSVQQTNDDGYIFTGQLGGDLYLIKTDSIGSTLWVKVYGGNDIDQGMDVRQTFDNGYIVVGSTHSFGAGGYDVWLLKTDNNGDTLWTRTCGTSNYDFGRSVRQTFDGGYIIAGTAVPNGFYLVKTDSVGSISWTQTFAGAGASYAHCVQQTVDSGYVVAGYTNNWGGGNANFYIVRTNSLGDSLWARAYGDTSDDYGRFVQQTSDGGYIFVGQTTSFGAGHYDVWLLKMEPDVGIEEKRVTLFKNNDFGATIFSGPLLLPEDKKCKVFDITGRVVIPDKIKSGIYFIEVDGEIRQKVVKVR